MIAPIYARESTEQNGVGDGLNGGEQWLTLSITTK